jgi:hypothetical protein
MPVKLICDGKRNCDAEYVGRLNGRPFGWWYGDISKGDDCIKWISPRQLAALYKAYWPYGLTTIRNVMNGQFRIDNDAEILCLQCKTKLANKVASKVIKNSDAWKRRQTRELASFNSNFNWNRHYEVIELVISGCSNKEIARQLGISPTRVMQISRKTMRLLRRHTQDLDIEYSIQEAKKRPRIYLAHLSTLSKYITNSGS